ncbi:hypothetical protein [Thermosulfurimonas sp. F29]|uniref:hypothetical protein n=1 Tax=Thermosulfurimonas sp. F29 TaxID=2867247 RepID=UPI001C82F24B|nr:hypothetical protein [Thermosulfurimonas sp. F29]MBX6422496.1 hypothetical protein [Thermosulfurimonas sp. F29]
MDKDFELKVRINNILWSLNCYTRIEIKLAEYSSQTRKPTELTDIDVLGIRVFSDMIIDYIVADCTTNKKIIKSPIQRIFWLKGVMDFFGTKKGYLCLGTNQSIPENQRIVAQKLGITILNQDNLLNLEKRVLDTNTKYLNFSNPECWLYFERNISQISKDLEFLLLFRKHYFWMNSPYQNISRLLIYTTKYAGKFNPKDKFHKALAVDLLTLFSLSILQMSSYVFHINPENPELELRSYFYGGYDEMKRRETIVDYINKLLQKMCKQGQLFEVPTLQLDPDYLPNLFDIAFRLLNKPKDSSQILRYLQLVLFEKVLYQGNNVNGIKYIDSNFSDITKKLTRDLAKFFCSSTGLSEELLQDIFK